MFQSRYATALIKGNFTLPSKEEMLEEWQKHVDEIKSKGRPLSNIHFLGEKEVSIPFKNKEII